MLAIFVFANLFIFAGYIFAATTVAPRLRVSLKRTLYGGVVFFMTCGITHLEQVFHSTSQQGMTRDDFTSAHMVIIHVIQAIAVWMFLTGLYKELTTENLTFKERGRK